MGFFSKLMKNPLVQMALPMAMSYFMPGIGSLVGTSAISNPMMRSAAEQALLGYGTAALTGSKHPEKAAMYSGLASMPFSFMKASDAANMYNKGLTDYNEDIFKTERYIREPAIAATAKKSPFHPAVAGRDAIYDYRIPETNRASVANFLKQQEALKQQPLTPWDVLKGSDDRLNNLNVPERRISNVIKDRPVNIRNPETKVMEQHIVPRSEWRYGDPTVAATEMNMPEVDFYGRVSKGGRNLLGSDVEAGTQMSDWTPTMVSQTAGLYGGRATDEEEWEDAKSRRRKELAFMYGIPEDMLGGEMENPYYGGGGFWRDGGIATLEMDNGGAVNGPGGPKDDVIDAKLSDGEFVMTAKAVENLGGGNRLAGAKRMYQMMNQLDPQSESVQESVIGV